MYTDSTLRVIQDNHAFNHVDTGVKYPKNWKKDSIEGLYKVTETSRPDDTETEVTTGFVINEAHAQVWQTRLKTAEELQNDINSHNAKIDAELLAADMKIIRALVEGDTALINAHKASQAAKRLQKK